MMSQNVSPGAPCVTIAIVIRGVSAFPAPMFALPSSAFLPPPLLHAPAVTARLTTSAAPRSRLPDLNISLPFFQEFLIDCGCRPVGVRHRRRPATGEHVADAARCLGAGRSGGSPRESHPVRRQYDVGVVEQRMVLWGLGIEDVEADTAELSGLQRRERGVEIEQPAATAVDQIRSRPHAGQELLVDKTVGLLREGNVQR